jgi:Xaa-Pro aminopeptidase
MTLQNLEAHNEGFSLELFSRAQEKAKEAVAEVAAMIKPGMKESEAYKLMLQKLRDKGAKKFWHPVHVRFGSNTLYGYKEKSSVDPILKENDIFFFDIGPVFSGHEGDFGETFSFGCNPEYQKIVKDVKEIFYLGKKAWQEEGLSGIRLLDYCEKETKKRGWMMSPSYVKGHRLSSFPHSLITQESLEAVNFPLGSNVWVLEVQIRHPEKPIGAFFEDVLA